MSNRLAAVFLVAGIVLAGCSGSSSDSIGPTNPDSGNGNPGTSTGVGVFHANFIPLSGVLPYPTDLYFSGSTDGTLNIPSTPFLPNAAAVNALDGFSTVATATARFSAPIDPATISPATVFMFEVDVDNATKATIGFRRPLVYGTDFTARVATTVDSDGATLEIVPLKPLTASTGDVTNNGVGYLVILTNGLKDTSSNAATPDRDYLAIKDALPTCAAITNASLNGICRLTGAHIAIASAVLGPTIPAIVSTIVLTFSFSTQATADTMNVAAANAQPGDITATATGFNLQTYAALVNVALPPIADIYAGQLSIPYFLDPAAPLTGHWEAEPGGPGVPSTNLTRFNPVPVKKTDLDIPLFVTVPNAQSGQAKPAAGWPIVIFQHGLTGNRTNALAVAARYALAGFVVAAIDIPLHGVTNTLDPMYQPDHERTFDLDIDGSPGIDASGSYIFNLTSLLTSRDNLREGAIDIVQLATSLPNLDLDGDLVSDVDPARVHFAALSLGALVGTVANAMQIPTVSAYLNTAGGGVANLLRESAALSERINPGLASKGLLPGYTLYEQFFRDAQTVVDAGDPINYIATTVARRPVLLTQVLNDTVVPNSSTQRLINAAPFLKTNLNGSNLVAAGLGTWVHFTSGSHISLLSPAAGGAVTTEMQTHAVTLAQFGGTQFVITNPTILEP